MIQMDFRVIQLDEYDKYLIGYQGMDLSYLSVKPDKYLNKWAMPCVTRSVDDRELILKYAVPDRRTAQQLAKDAMLTSSFAMITSRLHPNRNAFCSCDGVSWDEFSNRIEVTVRLLVESGFLEKETYSSKQVVLLVHEEGNGTSLDWELDLNPSTSTDRPITVFWEIGNWVGDTVTRFEMKIPNNDGSAIHFSTREPEKSTIGGRPLIEAIKRGYVFFSGPLIPDSLDNEHATGVEFNVHTDLDCTINWTIWKRYLLP